LFSIYDSVYAYSYSKVAILSTAGDRPTSFKDDRGRGRNDAKLLIPISPNQVSTICEAGIRSLNVQKQAAHVC